VEGDAPLDNMLAAIENVQRQERERKRCGNFSTPKKTWFFCKLGDKGKMARRLSGHRVKMV